MAQCVQSVQELIPDSFVPCVAALCSDEAERLTRLNHLSFAELLKPFSRLTSEGTCCSSPSIGLKPGRGREKEVGKQVGDGGAAARGCGWRGAASGCQDRALAAARLRTLSSSGRARSLSRRDKLEPDARESRLLFAVTRQDLAPTGHLR